MMRAPHSFDPSAPLWSGPLFGEPVGGFDHEALDAMEVRAEQRDWAGYMALARQVGILCPRGSFSDGTRSISPLQPLQFAVSESSCDEILAGFLPHLSPAPTQELLDALLLSECDGMFLESIGSFAIAPLLRAGASMVGAAGPAARSGNITVLSILLDNGLSPNAQDPGWMPLILEALSKDRLYGSSDKMLCAKMLWDRGARLDTLFPLPGNPDCLLDLAIREIDYDSERHPDGAPARPWSSFCFPWNYFDEAGIPAWALLPPEDRRQANARIAAMLGPDAPITARLGASFDEEHLDGLRRPNPWIPMSKAHPWLAAAVEIAALRLSPPAPPSIRRKAI